MRWQWVVGIALALLAAILFARDLRRADADPLRRPATLFVGALVVAMLAGTFGGRSLPNPWWLVLPAAVLAWEATRGWRKTPRCHRWEGGVAAWAVGLGTAAAGLGLPGAPNAALLAAAGAACLAGTALMAWSFRREPRSWRRDDSAHYERRDVAGRDAGKAHGP